MVSTPWSDSDIPFEEAAEIGTRKVINEHSTIGLVITTDGTIGDITRSAYEPAEERVVSELKAINKPFVMVLNSRYPTDDETVELCAKLSAKYDVPVIPVSCIELTDGDIRNIIEKILFEFPVKEIKIDMPSWIVKLPHGHWLKSSIYSSILEPAKGITRIAEVADAVALMAQNENLKSAGLKFMNLGDGSACVDMVLNDGLFYRVLGEETGFDIEGEESMIDLLRELSAVKKEYDKVATALVEVKNKGYGIVTPSLDELTLEAPEIVKQGGKFGVRLRASAPAVHLIRTNIETEVNPIVGSEKQSEELVKYLMQEFEDAPEKIWESNMFGKSLHDLVNEGLISKLNHTPDEARSKLQHTLERIVNEGAGGLICIIL